MEKINLYTTEKVRFNLSRNSGKWLIKEAKYEYLKSILKVER